MAGDASEDFSFVAMFPEALKPVTIPMSTGFYNIFAMIGLFPELEQVEKRPVHHLRYHNTSSMDALAEQATLASQDAIQERRKAKAMKVCIFLYMCIACANF